MNHQKIYDTIIEKANSENRVKLRKNQEGYVYYERHHIFPKCLGGGDEKENLVLLTAREHFVCHKLLTYIYKGNYKIINAFSLMIYMNKRKYGITSRDYEYVRKLYNKYKKGKTYEELYGEEKAKEIKNSLSGEKNGMYGLYGANNPNFGSKRSKEQIKNISESHIGQIPWNKGLTKDSDIRIPKTPSKAKGKTYEELYGEEKAKEIKKKQRDFNLNKLHPCKNRRKKGEWKPTEEQKQHMRHPHNINKIKCEYCFKIISLNIYNRCHGDKCKYKPK